MTVIYSIFFFVTILVSVAFFTLFERKILGYVHMRVGPNKNALTGVGQPFNDLIKLFSKMDYMYSFSSLFLFFFSPMMMVIFSLTMWSIFCHESNQNMMKYFFMFLMIINGLLTFFFLFPGWGSGSFYSSLGGYRASAQCISYEAIFFFCIMFMIFLFFSFSLMEAKVNLAMSSNLLVVYPVMFSWLLSVMAESNRTPFDFAEGESELVSGFNTEYGSGLFSIIFLSEYMSMYFYSFMSSFFLFGNSNLFLFGIFLLLTLYVWIRTAFPRLRYDKLMVLSWKSIMFQITGIFLMIFFFLFF